MLAEERFSSILSIIEAAGSATIQELMTALDASESTVRRDLITMDENGLLTKVHGGNSGGGSDGDQGENPLG